MRKAALIVVEGDEIGTLPVLLERLAGQTLLERHAAQIAASGAHQLIILAERPPASLMSAIARLEPLFAKVELARSSADAADKVHPDQDLILLSGALLLETADYARVAVAQGSALLCTPRKDAPGLERIDGNDAWLGLLKTDGQKFRDLVANLGDWDLCATLLRTLVQAKAERIHAGVASGTIAGIRPENAVHVSAVQRQLAQSVVINAQSIATQVLANVISERLVQSGQLSNLSPKLFQFAAHGAGLLTIVLAVMSQFLAALALFVMAIILHQISRGLAELRPMQAGQARDWSDLLALAFPVGIAVAHYGNPPFTALCLTLALMWLLLIHLRHKAGPGGPLWVDALVVAGLLSIFAVLGWPLIGLSAAILAIGLAQFRLQQIIARP